MERRKVWMLALRGVLATVFGAFRRPGDVGQRVVRAVAGLLGIGFGTAALVWPGITATAAGI